MQYAMIGEDPELSGTGTNWQDILWLEMYIFPRQPDAGQREIQAVRKNEFKEMLLFKTKICQNETQNTILKCQEEVRAVQYLSLSTNPHTMTLL